MFCGNKLRKDVMMWNSPEKIKNYLDTWRSSNSNNEDK
jgi:hypothetical protein